MGIWMVNVHALGGIKMMTAARGAIDQSSHQPLLTAVTILTSHDQSDLTSAGISMTVQECVSQLADNARQAGCDGVVCSALEVQYLRQKMGSEFVLVTPGIRPAGSNTDDQSRVVSPIAAIELGADYLVIGRPVTKAEDPGKILVDIHDSLKSA
jgi:orotidine-5'-phosphate decarboxylase